MFFKKSNRSVRDPDETIRLSPNIEVVIWRDGNDARFGINRVDAKGISRRTFSFIHLGELVDVVCALLMASSQLPGVDESTASENRQLAAGVTKLREEQRSKVNGSSIPEQPSVPRLFG